jgi:hypothetical protein
MPRSSLQKRIEQRRKYQTDFMPLSIDISVIEFVGHNLSRLYGKINKGAEGFVFSGEHYG